MAGGCSYAERIEAQLQHFVDLEGTVFTAANWYNTIPFAVIFGAVFVYNLHEFFFAFIPVDRFAVFVTAASIANTIFVDKKIWLCVWHNTTLTIFHFSPV
jgi:hypothetical protein